MYKKNLNKVLVLLKKNQVRKFIFLGFFLIIGMLMEILALATLYPVINLILNEGNESKSEGLNFLVTFFNIKDYYLVSFLLFFLTIVYLIKNVFLVFLTHRQNIFLASFNAHLNNRLFKNYIFQPYAYHIRRNIGDIIKNLQVEVNHFGVYCTSLLQIIIEFSLSIAILATLVYVVPIGSLIIGLIFTVLSFVYFQFTKSKLKGWGKTRQDIEMKSSSLTFESLSAIKELKLFSKENHFVNIYADFQEKLVRLNSSFQTISQSPRFFLEIISIIGLCVFIIVYSSMGFKFNELIPFLGLCVAATFRLIPSINRLIGAFQNLKYYSSSVNKIYDELENNKTVTDKPNNIKAIGFKKQIIFDNVNFSYLDNENIIENLNLKIKKGTSIGITGMSGNGKSTFLNLLCGLLNPKNGKIIVDDNDIEKNSSGWQKNIGYVSQDVILLNDSILNNIVFGEEEINLEKVYEILNDTSLIHFVNKLENGLNTSVGERGVKISGGQRQRIGIARALYKSPEILILDEATSSLDKKTEDQIIQTIKNLKNKITIVFVTHNKNLLSFCDLEYELNKKRLQENK